MSKIPNRYFWLPLRLDVLKQDTLRLNVAQHKLYIQLLEAYWIADCDIIYAELAEILSCKKSDIDTLFSRVPGFESVDGKVHHATYLEEYRRALRRSEAGTKAIRKRFPVIDGGAE